MQQLPPTLLSTEGDTRARSEVGAGRGRWAGPRRSRPRYLSPAMKYRMGSRQLLMLARGRVIL